MIRKIIVIDEEKCNGCGACAAACHEGAIGMVNGKAKLLRDDYCDGLGDCLPACPTNAISFTHREAAAYDEKAVQANKLAAQQAAHPRHVGGCPGTRMRQMRQRNHTEDAPPIFGASQLAQWPCQIRLVPEHAPYFQGTSLLIAADCTAYAYAAMHQTFLRGKTTLIGCPKLDDVNYAEKLTRILRNNDIQDVTVVRMEVPCCGGLEHAAREAVQNSGKALPFHVTTISIDGIILNQT